MKKALSIFLALCLMLSCLPVAALLSTALPKAHAEETSVKALQFVQNGEVEIADRQNSSVWFGEYLQSGSKQTGYNVDPIKWRILSNADGKLFLLADQDLDHVYYHEADEYVSWETCSLRAWLNGYGEDYADDSFIGSAFSTGEKAAIAETQLQNADDGTSGNTVDKVFPLSINELSNTAYGFASDPYAEDPARIATITAYCAGGGRNNSSRMNPGEKNGYWIRTFGSDYRFANLITIWGSESKMALGVNSTGIAIRPALNVDLNSVLFVSAAEGGKQGSGALAAIGDCSDGAWKLTLFDGTRDLAVEETAFTVRGSTLGNVSCGPVKLHYSGATVGENEYISAILTDADGNALYYGRVAQPEAADGEVTVNLPALTGGTYTLKVFSEQYNGDNKTDFASACSDVTLTVKTPEALQLMKNNDAANLAGGQQSMIYIGSYKQSSDGAGGFKVEPIKWRLLKSYAAWYTDEMILLADRNLDRYVINDAENADYTWNTSTLRSWLNGYSAPYNRLQRDYRGDNFIHSAFTDAEIGAIPQKYIQGGSDRVFLISDSDAANGNFGFHSDDARIATDTAYAASGGRSGIANASYGADQPNPWWLLTAGDAQYSAKYVDRNGQISNEGVSTTNKTCAVRPAISLYKRNVLFTAAAEGGKSFAEAIGSLYEIPAYTGNEWTLTMRDESRSFSVTETAERIVCGEEHITLHYSGAKVGANEYVSAILADAAGDAFYYGRLAEVSAADGEIALDLPALNPGSYTLKVFSEQYNGDYKMDFASPFADVALTVFPTQLDIVKTDAKAELDSYKDAADYDPGRQLELAAAISAGEKAIDAAQDADAVAAALAQAKAAIDLIDTKDPCLHPKMYHFWAIEDPLCGEDGNIECWWCTTCKHYFADRAGTQELAEEDCFFESAYPEHDFTYDIGFEEREDRCWLSYPAYYDAVFEDEYGVSVTDYFDAVGYSFRYCSHCGAVMVTGYDEEQEFERWNEEFSWLTLHTPGEGDPTEGYTCVPFTPAGLSEGDYWINRPGYLNDRLGDFNSSSQYYAAAEQAVRNAKFYVNKDTGMLRMIFGNSVLDYSLSDLSGDLYPDPVFLYLYQLSVIPDHDHYFSVYIQNSTENAQEGEYYYDCESLAEETGQQIYDSGLAVEICNKYDAVQLRGYPFQEIHVFAEEPMFAKYLKIMPGLGEALPFSDEGLADGDYWFDMEGLIAAYQDLEDMSDAQAQQYREATVRLADDGSFLRIANPDFAYHQNRDSRIGTFCSFYLRVKGQDAPACFSPIPTEDSDALAFGDYWFDVDRMLLSDSYLKAAERQAYRSATYYLSCNKNLIMANLGDLGVQRLYRDDQTFALLRQHGDVPSEGFRKLAVIAQGQTPAEVFDWGGWYIDFEAFFEAYLASRSGPAPTEDERQELYNAALARLREKTLYIDRFQRLAAYNDVFSIVTPEMLEPYYDFILPAVRYYNSYTQEAFYPLPTEDSDALEAGQYYYDFDGMRAATSEAYEYWVVNLEDSVWAISPDGSTILADDYWWGPYVPETGTESGDFDYAFLRQHGVEFVCTHKDVELYSNSRIKPVHDTVFISADADPVLQYCTCYYCSQCHKFLFYDAGELIAALYLRELPVYGLKYIDAHCDDDDDDGVCDICGGPYYMLTEEPSYQRYYLVVPEEDADLAEDTEVWIYKKYGETRFAFYYRDELLDPNDEDDAEYCEIINSWITAPLVCPGHEWDNGAATQKATFTEDGVMTFTCGICGETRTESIPKIDSVTLSDPSFSYNGNVQKPTVTVKDSTGKVLTEGTDYTLTWSNANSRDAGYYTVTVTGAGTLYSGSTSKSYNIIKQFLGSADVTLSATSFTYNGAVQKPTVTVKDVFGKTLTEGTDYTVTYSNANSKAAGSYTVTVIGKGNYTNSAKKNYTIKKQVLDAANITLSATSFTYNSAVQKPTVTVKNAAGTKLTEGTSYTLTWSNENSKAPGTYTVTVTAAGSNYSGSASKTYTIAKQPLAAANITLSATSFTYNSAVQKPTVTVKNAAGTKLTEGTHYSLTWSNENSKAPGTYTVTVTAAGSNYSGSVSKTYKIAKQSLAAANITLSATSFTYNSAVQKPTVTVKNAAGTKLTEGTHYTLTWSNENSKAPGTFTVTVTGKGTFFSGSVKKTYKITKQALSSANITLSATSFTYNSAVQKPTVTVKNAAGKTLALDTAYTLTWSNENSKAPGTYTVTVTAMGSYYSGTVKKTYTIAKQPLAAANITLSATSFTYNSAVQKPTVTVKNASGTKLKEGTSYTLTWSNENSKAPGTYTVTVTGTGTLFTGSASKTYTIAKQPLKAANITLSDASFTYNGSVQKPTVTVKNAAGTKLKEGTSYALTWSNENSKAPGSYTVTVTAESSYYSGSVKKTYKIEKQPLDAANITLSAASFTYNGSVQKPTVTVKNAAGTKLKEGTSYALTWSNENSKAPGTYTVTVTAESNYYSGTVSKTYTIAKQPLKSANITLSAASFTYDGAVQKPTVTVKNDAGTKLKEGTSYVLTWSNENSKAPGTYTVTVTAQSSYYSGSVKKTYTIGKQPLASANITLSATSYTYNGKVRKPTVTVKNAEGKTLTEGTSYTVEYSNASSKAPGTYTVTLTAKGNYYTGTVSKTYKIKKQTLSAANVTLSATSFTYNGKVQKPTVTVKNAAGTVLTEGTSYTVTYSSGCKAKGTYTVTVTAKGSYYTGTVEKTFTIK